MAAPDTAFGGFRPDAIQFLAALGANNDRAWFQPRKAEYERLLKAPLEALLVALAAECARRSLPFAVDPRRSPFRFYRDTRFSKDKSPYKTHVGASFTYLGGSGEGSGGRVTGAGEAEAAAGGGAEAGAGDLRGNGAYFSFGPGEMVVGGGLVDPGKRRLERLRGLIVRDPERVRAGLDDPAFVAEFGAPYAMEALKRVPPGLPPDHPMADRLRWKNVVWMRPLSDDEAFSPDLPRIMADSYEAALPAFRFLASL